MPKDRITKLEQPISNWDVVVWNDPITLMPYLTMVFRKLFGYDHRSATKLTLQIHNKGKAVVTNSPREQAEASATQLHAFGLRATITKEQLVTAKSVAPRQ